MESNLLFGVGVNSRGGADDESQNFILFIFVPPRPNCDTMLFERIHQGCIKSLEVQWQQHYNMSQEVCVLDQAP